MSDRCYCDALIESGKPCNYCVMDQLKARVGELEEENAALKARVQELEAEKDCYAEELSYYNLCVGCSDPVIDGNKEGAMYCVNCEKENMEERQALEARVHELGSRLAVAKRVIDAASVPMGKFSSVPCSRCSWNEGILQRMCEYHSALTEYYNMLGR